MVAIKLLAGGKRRHSHGSKKHAPRKKVKANKSVRSVAVIRRLVKKGSAQARKIIKDPLHKLGKCDKDGKCKVALSKAGQKVRAQQLAHKGPKRKGTKKKHSKKKKK